MEVQTLEDIFCSDEDEPLPYDVDELDQDIDAAFEELGWSVADDGGDEGGAPIKQQDCVDREKSSAENSIQAGATARISAAIRAADLDNLKSLLTERGDGPLPAAPEAQPSWVTQAVQGLRNHSKAQQCAKVVSFLIGRGARVDRSVPGASALWTACMAGLAGDHPVTQILLDNGADVNTGSPMTCLEAAIMHGHLGLARALVGRGAKAEQTETMGQAIMMSLVTPGDHQAGFEALFAELNLDVSGAVRHVMNLNHEGGLRKAAIPGEVQGSVSRVEQAQTGQATQSSREESKAEESFEATTPVSSVIERKPPGGDAEQEISAEVIEAMEGCAADVDDDTPVDPEANAAAAARLGALFAKFS